MAGYVLAALPCRADPEIGASPWIRAGHAAVRLLVAGPEGGAERRAAIELRLDPGYLTYWRQPGDAGLPPRFDTSASVNVAGVKVAFPAPELLDEGGAQLFGYRDRVTFPLRATVTAPDRPATLTAAADFALCQAICIPVSATVSAPFPATTDPSVVGVIGAAERSIPKLVALDDPGPLSVLRARRVELPGPAIEVQVRARGPATLFVEGPDGWFFPAVPVAPGEGGGATVTVPILQRPDEAVPAVVPLTLTLVDPAGAIEVATPVDG